MKYVLTFLVAAVYLVACESKQDTNRNDPASADKQTEDSLQPKTYFPVIDFLRGEMNMVDSLPVGIMKYTTEGKKTDSQYIKLDEFHQLANEFLSAELLRPQFEEAYEETSFFDKSANSSTFLYTTKNNDLQVQRVDVLSENSGAYDKIKSIYLEKIITPGDSVITKKMYWKPQRNFQITTLLSVGSKKPEIKLIKVVWDNRN